MIRLWNVTNLRAPPRTFVSAKEGEEDFQPYHIFFSANGKVMAVKSAGDTGLRLWDVTTGKELPRPAVPRVVWEGPLAPHGKTWAGVEFPNSGSTFTEQDGEISLWDVATGKKVRRADAGPGRCE